MKIFKKFTMAMLAVTAAALLSAGAARADDVRIGWGFLFPIPVPIPIYQVPHEPSVVTVGLLFPIPVPLPVYDYGYHGGAVRVPQRPERYGRLQTIVRPADAEVFIDGKYYGRADDFYTRASAVTVYPGQHRLEFRAPGYRNYAVEAYIAPGSLVSIEHDLQPLSP